MICCLLGVIGLCLRIIIQTKNTFCIVVGSLRFLSVNPTEGASGGPRLILIFSKKCKR